MDKKSKKMGRSLMWGFRNKNPSNKHYVREPQQKPPDDSENLLSLKCGDMVEVIKKGASDQLWYGMIYTGNDVARYGFFEEKCLGEALIEDHEATAEGVQIPRDFPVIFEDYYTYGDLKILIEEHMDEDEIDVAKVFMDILVEIDKESTVWISVN
jgi:hypothetical protein